MYLGLPVWPLASMAILETMGQARLLFPRKDYEAPAEVVDLLVKDNRPRQQIIEVQKQRLVEFMEAQVKQKWHHFLRELGII